MTAITQPIDINPTYLETIQHILDEHVPNCEVRAFGSRAKWIARDYSDLDLVIVGDQPLGWRALGQLETAFKESDLPFRVDVLDWHDISDNFRTLIEVDCVVIKNGSMQYTKWSEKPIGEVAKIVGGSTPSTKVPENFGGNIPWITPKDLSDSQNRYIYRGKRNLSQKGLEDCSAKLLPQGTVLLSTRAPVGYVAIAGTNIATNQGFRNLLFDKNIVDPEFAYYWLTSNTEELERHASGSTFKELSGSALKNIQMPVPSLSEQRRIVHILGTLDDKIELNRRINKTLEAMAQTLFKSWFVDFDPVRAKMEGRWRPGESLPGLPAHLYDLFPNRLVSSELGEIPESWQCVALHEVINVNPTRPLKRGKIAPYLSMSNMPTKGHTPDKIFDEPYGAGMKFMNGDTLVARITPCLENGKVAYIDSLQDDEVGWGSTEYIVMRPKPPLPNEYAYLLARDNTFIHYAVQNMHGTSGRQRISGDAVSSYNLTLPYGAQTMGVFGKIVGNIFSQASKCAQESHTLRILRDSLLQKLLSNPRREVNAANLGIE